MSFFTRIGIGVAVLTALFVLSLVLPEQMHPVVYRVIMLCGIAIIMAVSLNLINGFTGQFSIGHAGFQAVGAYSAAAFTVYAHDALFPYISRSGVIPSGPAGFLQSAPAMILALIVGGLVAAVIGYVVGLPSLRLRGDYLAIVTLGFGEIIRVVAINTEAVGGATGFQEKNGIYIPALTNFFWIYLVVIATVVVAWRIRFSVQGLSFLAVREDEVAAQAMGINTTKVKVTAFVLGSFFAGMAGALYAHFDQVLIPTSYGFIRSFDFVIMVVLGGLGSISGAVLSAVFLTAVPEILRFSSQYRLVTFSLLLIILMLVRPQGLFGIGELRRDMFFGRRRPAAEPITGAKGE